MSEKIKLVVLNENILGYIEPRFKSLVFVLHASILRGAPAGDYSSVLIGANSNIRLASEKDFDDFRVSFEGYNESEYEFAK